MKVGFFNLLHQNSILYWLTSKGIQFYSNVQYFRQFAKQVIVKGKTALAHQHILPDDTLPNGKNDKKLDFIDIIVDIKRQLQCRYDCR